MKSRHAAVLAAVAGLAPLAAAQVERPKFSVWSAGGQPQAERFSC